MNPKALIPLVAGLAIAGFAAKMGFDHLQKAQGKPTKLVTLWSVTQDVPRGSPVTEENLTPLEFPLELAPQTAISKKENIVGRVPHTGVPAGVPILNSMLLAPGQMPGINVPEGFRAVAVKVDESSGVDSHLQPGVFVDVIGLFTVRANNRNETIAKTVVEKVQVAAVGARIAPSNPNATSADGERRPAKPARAVTLLVRPQHVPPLHLAEQRGKIKLSMRSTGDLPVSNGQLAAITEDELLGLVEPEEDEPEESGPPVGDQIAGFFESLFGGNQEADVEPEPEPEPEPVVAAPKPKQPEVIWTMAVYNGDSLTRLGWTAEHPFEPIQLGESGGNVFEQNDGYQPPLLPAETRGQERRGKNPRKRNTQQRRNGSDAGDAGGEPNEPAEVIKPQELFG